MSMQPLYHDAFGPPPSWTTAPPDDTVSVSKSFFGTLANANANANAKFAPTPDTHVTATEVRGFIDNMTISTAGSGGGFGNASDGGAGSHARVLFDAPTLTGTLTQPTFTGTLTYPTANAARTLTNACHGPAKAAGWWHDLEGNELTIDTPRFVVEKLCLVHSEISEAMEGHRKGLMDDKLPHRSMLEVELADAAIRIFDMAGGFGLDVAGAIAEKLAFNRTRLDHQLANRRTDSGKKF